jgi:type I restriction enzyme S subunit
MDEKRKLPEGWRWVRLGEVCELNPRRPPVLATADDAPTTFVPMQAVDERLGIVAAPEIRPFREVRKGYTYFSEGDVLFAKITPCMQNGKHAIAHELVGGFGFGTTEFHVLRPSPEITAEWIHFYVRQPGVLENAKAYFTGAVGQRRVPESYLADLEIPLPAAEEQKWITAILDEQMRTVERARAAAEAQLAAAEALPAAYLGAAFSSPEAQQWPMRPLPQVLFFQEGPGVRSHQFREKGVKLLNVTNLVGGYLRLDNTSRYLDKVEAYGRYKHFFLEAGDIVLASSGASWGKVAVARPEDLPVVMNTSTIRLHPLDETLLCRDFARFFVESQQFKTQITRIITGAAQPNFGPLHLRQVLVPVPPLPDQQHIAARLTEQMASAERTRKAVEEELDTINKLPTALLRRAFSGAL